MLVGNTIFLKNFIYNNINYKKAPKIKLFMINILFISATELDARKLTGYFRIL